MALPLMLMIGPVLPGLYWTFAPALETAVWQALWLDPQWPQALRSTLISSVAGTLLACAMAGMLATLHYPALGGNRYNAVCRCCWRCRTPPLR
ncbi:hypothetical protein ACVBEH_00570 [Roseateles sp. GG27B]